VEIDPAVSEAARRYLGLHDNPRLRVVDADARPFLRRTDKRYDLIFVDAYRQPYIPFYLATREFFRLARERLAPGGVLALNVAQVPGDDRLSEAIGSTLLAEFPQGWAWKPLRFNELMLGFDRPVGRVELLDRARSVDSRIASLVPLLERQLRPVHAEVSPLTDDQAPVEWLTDRMIVDYIAEGGGDIEEDLLPTAP